MRVVGRPIHAYGARENRIPTAISPFFSITDALFIWTMAKAQGKLKFRTWGGARKGAGRKPGPRPKVRHRARPRFKKGCPVLVTYRLVRSDLRQDAVLAAVRHVLLALHEQLAAFRVIDFSIQDDHLHLIVEADDAASFKSGYYALSIRLGKRINAALGTSGRVFADRGHFRHLTTPREVRNARGTCS